MMVYRESQVKAAGFSAFPKTTDEFLKLMQALKAKGTPGGFALGHATGDANTWCYWLVWAFGGKMVDANNKVVIDSPETIKALEYAKELYATFVPGTLSWLDPSNNKAFLDGQVSVTNNGISIYYAAKTSQDPKIKALTDDINHALYPVGPVGTTTAFQLFFNQMIFKYTKYPKAAKEFLRFMMEEEQFGPWMQASIGYVAQPLKAYEKNPIWTVDPKHTAYRDVLRDTRPAGYAGKLGYASAGALADFIVVDMVAEAASGSKSPKEAAERAQKRAERYYKV
jgi:multiple sugar transport system substrate-binding protein